MKKIFIPILIFFISASSFAQGGEKMKERIRAQKIAFITDKLNLTSDEAQGFWPIYNAYEETVENIKSVDLRAIKMAMRKGKDISDKQADELLQKLIKAEEEIHTAKLKLVEDLKEVISSKKIIRLKGAEDQFNKMLLERLREFREKRNKNRN
ncbi:sensor of ECF-type sigma factor [uncultured Winogradskyella sp.]|uniref:sensor of ECF-type sigma factor n=1 Tax=uncultured Winogradskyella sp. TaxID=395353 RepID=UPI002608900C|nr:sensor of ECF-type sigma factor [uncultured Winogradskyella sp.]